MSGSTIDAALAGLVAAWTGVVTGVEVIDGPPFDPNSERVLCIGWDESDQPAVTANRTNADMKMSRDAESFDVSNLLTFWAGNLELSAVRSALFAAFDSLDAALKADPALGGAVARSRVTEYEYIPGKRAEGRLAQLRLTVHIDAWK